ncbi:MAG: hypothetical protein K9K40_13385 [Desulfotignum sp.]|nr:hypothetical protein [Desulfotignum sp.]MCF8126100.1 hypothetical protein [Desulfotignum sp.]
MKPAVCLFCLAVIWSLPSPAFAIQLHMGNEGIIVHQLGHIFFMLSMVGLMFTINSKKLTRQKGWRLIQYAALFFIFWNLNTLAAHFLDNQIAVVRIKTLSLSQMTIVSQSDSQLLAGIYYFLKLDHIWCVPAMVFLFSGLNCLLRDQVRRSDSAGG